jgi:hypothetical protein
VPLPPHQSLDNLLPMLTVFPPHVESLGPTDIVCHERLGGWLKHYERKAA